MAVITVNVSHLCIFSLVMLSVMANIMELTPLCGTMDGSPPKDSDKIYFKDKNQRIRTVEINGTIYACYPDGTMIDTTSSSSAENSGERITGQQLHDRIRDDEKNLTTRDVSRFIANVSRCSTNNQTFCSRESGRDESYPFDVIQKLLRKHLHKFADVFGTDDISSDIINRSDAFDEIDLCDSYETVIHPTSGKNKNGEELYIFNTPEHKQGVRVSICKHKGESCKMTENFPNGYRTECKQHYVYRELLSLSPDGVPVKDKFEFPACCSCAVYRG